MSSAGLDFSSPYLWDNRKQSKEWVKNGEQLLPKDLSIPTKAAHITLALESLLTLSLHRAHKYIFLIPHVVQYSSLALFSAKT